MPGASAGIPASAMPTAWGRRSRRATMAPTGTWPSTTYPSTKAVWHEAASTGTPARSLNAARFGSSVTSTSAPFSCRYPTHSEQHPQPGASWTSTRTEVSSPGAGAARCGADSTLLHALTIATTTSTNTARTAISALIRPTHLICSRVGSTVLGELPANRQRHRTPPYGDQSPDRQGHDTTSSSYGDEDCSAEPGRIDRTNAPENGAPPENLGGLKEIRGRRNPQRLLPT